LGTDFQPYAAKLVARHFALVRNKWYML